MFTTREYDTVVVVGAGIGGLVAAAAASPLAQRVVVLDRDRLPDHPDHRPGTHQSLHSHGLLASGRDAMERLLPGFTDRVRERGGISEGDIGSSGRWWIGGGLIADARLDHTGVAASRPLIEYTLRELVHELPNVEIRDRVDVVGLTGTAERITGVEAHERGPEKSPWCVGADLVITSGGRTGRGWRWLEQLGVTPPVERRIGIGLRYATFHVRADGADLGGRVVSVSAATREFPRGAVAIRQEDGTWTITLFAYGDVAPPVDVDGIRQFAGTMVAPDVAALVADREPLDEPRTFRFPEIRRRLVEDLEPPLGFAALGDAICSFDPTFGQGMSVASLEALTLRRVMEGGLDAVRSDYHAAAARIVDGAWTIVRGTVAALPTTTGVTPERGDAVIGRYMRRLQRVARRDPVVAGALLRTTNLFAPPQQLLAPAIALRVLRPGAASSPRAERRREAAPMHVGAGV